MVSSLIIMSDVLYWIREHVFESFLIYIYFFIKAKKY